MDTVDTEVLPVPNGNKADAGRLAYVGSAPKDRKSNDWFTPPEYLITVRRVLGSIDLDPFSSEAANEVVKAAAFYDEAADAFAQDWSKEHATTAWMNPPYSGRLVAKAMARFMDEFALGSFSSGITLTNNPTETKWFQRALREGTAVCLTDHRIKFWNADGKHDAGANTRGQAFFLFTRDPGVERQFHDLFSAHGTVVRLEGGRR